MFSATTVTVVVLMSTFFMVPLASDESSAAGPAGTIDPAVIPKWVNQLGGPPPVYTPMIMEDDMGMMHHMYEVDMDESLQRVLPPPYPMTPVWGYGGMAHDALSGADLGYVLNSPGPTFEAVRGVPAKVMWRNLVQSGHMFAVDPTLHWADPNGIGHPEPPFISYPPGYPGAQSPVPLVTHLHGGEVQSTSDGHPEAWFTWDGKTGMAYDMGMMGTMEPGTAMTTYPNMQPPSTLWYHDHALGITRLNVMSGLAGFYLLRDNLDPVASVLPAGKYEMPLAIQDRTFKTDGFMWFPTEGTNPSEHPYWQPQFYGNTIMVNGLVWPNMNVDRGWYRFRILEGSNARYYTLSFVNQRTNAAMPFWVIGGDGGYLRAPVQESSFTTFPGERYDVLIDFSGLSAGTKIILKNSARMMMGGGGMGGGGMGGGGKGGGCGCGSGDSSTDQILQFTVTRTRGHSYGVNLIAKLPVPLNPTLGTGSFPTLPAPSNTRILTLMQEGSMMAPGSLLLDGQKWMSPVSEIPVQGSTEEWIFVNPTMMTHPMHLHLVQFQIVYRQKFDHMRYMSDFLALNGGSVPFDHPTVHVSSITPYLMGSPRAPDADELGWKDTVQTFMGEIAVIRVRFAGLDGAPYPFDPSEGPGYVWHCHIIDHEDNEMMRPFIVAAP